MASGRPDWFGSIVITGVHDSTFLPIAVDADGVMQAILTAGVLSIEQDELIVGASSEVSIFTITGKGSLFGGLIWTTEGIAQNGYIGKVKIILDEIDLGWQDAGEMESYNEMAGMGFPLTLFCKQAYAEGGHVRWGLVNELRFKASCEFQLKNIMTVPRMWGYTVLKMVI